MTKANMDIRAKAKNNSVYLWQVADKLKISEVTLIRKLRKELSAEQKKQVFDIIDELSDERKNA